MARTGRRIARIGTLGVGIALALVVGWYVFWVEANSIADLLGVLAIAGVVAVAARAAGRLAESAFPEYNVAEVAVEGPITRDGGGGIPPTPTATPADDIVEQIERADEDDGAEALLLKLNTPGGEVIPSDDIRRAAMDFEGPTIAYATDMCASGGYWIASGCDEFWARDASIVGSIGVIMSQVTAGDLLEKAGLTYEGIKAGEYKDALTSLKDLSADEREYLQGIADDFYDHFVDRVAEGRDLEDAEIRDTEAKVYLGERAHELGLVDELGAREAIEDDLESDLGEPVVVEEFEPEHGLTDRIGMGARSLAYAFGAGAAGALLEEHEGPKLR